MVHKLSSDFRFIEQKTKMVNICTPQESYRDECEMGKGIPHAVNIKLDLKNPNLFSCLVA